ncbi:bifunctional [glutamate--ammonia ligase]-adenylyl-L-tyrosine phosphorylase/[glutamate--ammonia-ligase] adenylyltransferase [Vibrio sp.]|nr:bifunctional [glutamate--ammonia ligase]-adenylyl-L-tyrosine phosphorylase/[glutamate--ammonia-ligase] adenylyltransferase [Vibrio sp.]
MQLPAELTVVSEANYQRLLELYPDIKRWPFPRIEQLKYILGLSQFVMDSLLRDSQLVADLPQMLECSLRSSSYRCELREHLDKCHDENSGYKILRHYRNREMVYIAWRDFISDWSITESFSHLSHLAEAMIFETYAWQYRLCCLDYGTPCNANGEPQPMLIIGMGKLGGGELNFSSDIDLIFTYPENGETQGARRSIANPVFFTRLGQRIIRSLEQHTAEGFCYRVDMRLRPFGDSGPLVLSYAALEDYYQEQGRDWERYAMVKARVMGCEMYDTYQELRQMLRPFVFRRYIDFSAIQSLRRMKGMIQSEVRRRGLVNNIKLGAGGIREIEFIVQVFQLIRGGREPELRNRGLLETLDSIEHLELLNTQEVCQLRGAYLFLRKIENLLQALADKQTQTLPSIPLEQTKLYTAAGLPDWLTLENSINQHMAAVHHIFSQLIGEEDEHLEDDTPQTYHDLWDRGDSLEWVTEILGDDLNLPHADLSSQHLVHFKQELAKKTLGPRGREVLNRIMPKVLRVSLEHQDAEFGLPRVLVLVQNIVTRTAYLELLDENPPALIQLVRLCTASPMISEKLTRFPILLDELIDPSQLYNPIPLESYKSELRDFLARIPEDDMEQQMEGLRQFKQISLLKVAAADIAGVLPIMKVSDHLTYLAEAIINAVLKQAWQQVTEKYGQPTHLKERDGKGFAVVGYGKVGGWELGYNSDLDLVFLHDCPDNVFTDGKKEIDGRQFYLRLVQRIIHIFSARTPSGILYEIDTRLRPSGASGLLVSSLDAFGLYQENEAWTWEHQALVRARVVCGEESLKRQFDQIRHRILVSKDQDTLRDDVISMRNKMREHLSGKKPGRFMLKQDPGGITDIEFLAQYLVLKFSGQYPLLTHWSDNIRIFESLTQEGVLKKEQTEKLIAAYTSMRDQIHRRNLLGLDADVSDDKFVHERENVISIWNEWLQQ